MRRHIALMIAALAVVLTLVGCGSSGESGQDAQPQQTVVQDQPGNPSVYRRIASMTDCAALQAEFDQADENHQRESDSGDTAMAEVATSYMEAADARMSGIGCYG